MLHPIKHWLTITKHRHKVMWYCFQVGIGIQGLRHDLSKYSFLEFWLGAKYYMGHQSPTAKEREIKGYSQAWLHHKGRNKHHYEYWTEFNGRTYVPLEIPIKYLKESFCDRIAACKVYLKQQYTPKSPLNYYLENNTDSILFPTSAKVLKSWLSWIDLYGEKKAFQMVRRIKTYEDMKQEDTWSL